MSFLDRLGQGPREPLLDAVTRNLQAIFASKKAFASAVRDFGLGDYESENSTAQALTRLAGEIEAAVRRFEPRLGAPAVTLLGRISPSRVQFALEGELGGARQRFTIEVDTLYRSFTITPDSHVHRPTRD